MRRFLFHSISVGMAFFYLSIAAQAESQSGKRGVVDKKAVIKMAELAKQEEILPAPKNLETVPAPMPGPLDLPVPEDIDGLNEKTEGADFQSGGNQVDLLLSPGPSASFFALGDDNSRVPPDVHGAVGPNHLMITLNTQVRIQNRSGGVISTVSLLSFWSSLGNPVAFDPRVFYDPYGGRWITVAAGDAYASTASLLIGVSQTSDPTGIWNLYSVDIDSLDIVWLDYPSLGFNKDWICVQGNMWNISGGFNRSDIYVFDKADLYSAGSGSYTIFSDTSIGDTQVPALTYDNTLDTLFLIKNWAGNSSGNGWLRIFTITGPVGSESFNYGNFAFTPNPWGDVSPGFFDFAPQLGSSQKIMTNDARIQNVVYRNGSLWCTHTIFLPAGGTPTRSSIQWWELSASAGIMQRGRIDDNTNTIFYYFPSIAVNAFDDVLIGYTRSSSSQYASGNYSFRSASDPSNTLQADTVLKAGVDSYYKTDTGGRNRWGDYTMTVVDPVNDISLWTIQQYAAASDSVDRWGTWWGRVDPPLTNDDCADAIPIGDVSNLPFNTLFATTDQSGYADSNIWYCYQATCSGLATISLCGSSFDTRLAVYDGCTCGPLPTMLASNDDNAICSQSDNSHLTVAVTAGNYYLIEVGGNNGATGAGLLSVSCSPGVLDDVAAISIDEPAGDFNVGNPINVAGTVENLGLMPQSFDAVMIIEDSTSVLYGDTVSLNLNPGQDSSVSFAQFTTSSIGEHIFFMSVDNAGDSNTANDTVSATFNASAHVSEGGPDAYGYYFIDNLGGGIRLEDPPVFNYIDISSTGDSLIAGDNDFREWIEPGFTFNFYGIDYDSIQMVTTNGLISFGYL
jgi:hypothetical protein